MTKKEVRSYLVKAFSKLDREQKANFRWHLKNGTEILCSVNAREFTREGAG